MAPSRRSTSVPEHESRTWRHCGQPPRRTIGTTPNSWNQWQQATIWLKLAVSKALSRRPQASLPQWQACSFRPQAGRGCARAENEKAKRRSGKPCARCVSPHARRLLPARVRACAHGAAPCAQGFSASARRRRACVRRRRPRAPLGPRCRVPPLDADARRLRPRPPSRWISPNGRHSAPASLR
jgi:hypothetical protein